MPLLCLQSHRWSLAPLLLCQTKSCWSSFLTGYKSGWCCSCLDFSFLFFFFSSHGILSTGLRLVAFNWVLIDFFKQLLAERIPMEYFLSQWILKRCIFFFGNSTFVYNNWMCIYWCDIERFWSSFLITTISLSIPWTFPPWEKS